eukprot:5230021-Alexandrium_andersonii.AAC.1
MPSSSARRRRARQRGASRWSWLPHFCRPRRRAREGVRGLLRLRRRAWKGGFGLLRLRRRACEG